MSDTYADRSTHTALIVLVNFLFNDKDPSYTDEGNPYKIKTQS